MPQSSLIRWRVGRGWIVLSGGGDFAAEETLDIDSNVLGRTVALGPLAYLWSGGSIERGDDYLDYVGDIGGRTGYLLDIANEQSPDIIKQLAESGLIVFGEGQYPERLYEALRGDVLAAIEQAYQNGATLYAQGHMASLLGSWMPHTQNQLQMGLGWLEDAIISAPYEAEAPEQLKNWLQNSPPNTYGIGLGRGAGLALSPDEKIEIWGQQAVTVLLHPHYNPPS